VTALAPERFALQVTIGAATQEKLLRAQALLRHQVPSGDLAEVLDRALDALLDKVEGRKFGKTRAPRPTTQCTDRRYVPREARRQAVARDGMQCSFVADDGRRCQETGFLEIDHTVPVARGGAGSAENVRVLCRSHNQYEAERILGRQVVADGRAAHALDDDLVVGLRRLGVTAGDARQAVAASRGTGTVEERLRAALGALGTVYASRGVGTGCRERFAAERGWAWSGTAALRARRGEERESGAGACASSSPMH
jgi:HNH endonuclease